MSGRSMEDIGSIFSKVAAKGKVSGDELLQLNEAGINATAALSKHLGKSSADVQKMVSSGQVDFATFSAAMQETFGEAASGANETFQGAMSNVRAALSRIGAKFADPALGSLRKVFVALIPAVNAVSKALDPLVDSFSGFVEALSGRVAAGVEEFTDALTETGSFALAFAYGLNSTFEGTRLGGFFESVGDSVGTFFETVRDGGGTLDGLKAALGYFGENCPALAGVNAVVRAFRVFTAALSDGASLGEAFGKAFSLDAFDGIRSAIDKVKERIDTLPQPIQAALSKLSSFGGSVSSILGGLSGEAVAFGGLFAGALIAVAPKVTALLAPFGGLVGVLSAVATSVGDILP